MLTQTFRRAASAITSIAPGISGAIVSMRTCPRAACQRRSKISSGRRDQIFRRMHPPPLVAEKWSFEMNAQRPSLHGITIRRGAAASIASANRSSAAQVASSGAATVVGKYPVTPCVVRNLSQARQFGWRGPHRIQSCSAVDMDIDKARAPAPRRRNRPARRCAGTSSPTVRTLRRSARLPRRAAGSQFPRAGCKVGVAVNAVFMKVVGARNLS